MSNAIVYYVISVQPITILKGLRASHIGFLVHPQWRVVPLQQEGIEETMPYAIIGHRS